MLAKIILEHIVFGIALVNGLTEHVADGDVFEAFGFDFDLAFGRVGITTVDIYILLQTSGAYSEIDGNGQFQILMIIYFNTKQRLVFTVIQTSCIKC